MLKRKNNMKNRLTTLFEQKTSDVLNIYCTAGYPRIDSTIEVINALQAYGADIIELGIPYSDPIADGPVIQQSNMQALKNGMRISILFDQLKNIRDNIHIPLIMMGYMNPVLQFGFEKFCKAASLAGIDAVIIPDLPMYEFETQYQRYIEQNDLKFIFLVTPETNEERLRKIDKLSSGFIYAVSSSSTTGNSKADDRQIDYFKKLGDMNLVNPVLVGFGIKDKKTYMAACQYTNGAIIGSAYINVLKNAEHIGDTTKEFLNTIRD